MDFSSYPKIGRYTIEFDEKEKKINIIDLYSDSLYLRNFIFYFDDDYLLKSAIVFRFGNINTINGIQSDSFYHLRIERVEEKKIEPLSGCTDGLLNFEKYIVL